MLSEELADSGPQPRVGDGAFHILVMRDSFGILSLLFTCGDHLLLLGLRGLRSAHLLDRFFQCGREQGNDGADVGRRVGCKANLGFKRVQFDGFLRRGWG